MSKTIALYGGGFKPPTLGHFEVVKRALAENPEIDEFIIYVGAKERNGITQAESIIIWEIYQTYLPMKV
jgi:nicotinamide mononucleotide adenylyltransferase